MQLGGRLRDGKVVQHGLAHHDVEPAGVQRQLLTRSEHEVDRVVHIVQLGPPARDGGARRRDVEGRDPGAAAGQHRRHLPHAAAQLEHIPAAQVAEELIDSEHRAVLSREGREVGVDDLQALVRGRDAGERVPFGDLDLVDTGGLQTVLSSRSRQLMGPVHWRHTPRPSPT